MDKDYETDFKIFNTLSDPRILKIFDILYCDEKCAREKTYLIVTNNNKMLV